MNMSKDGDFNGDILLIFEIKININYTINYCN